MRQGRDLAGAYSIDAQVQLIDAQRPGEALPDHAAVRRQVQAGQLPTQAVVDEALGEFDEEVTLHSGLSLRDVEAVVEQAVENGLADRGVVVGLLGYVQGPGAEGMATSTTGLIFCIADFQPGDAVICQGTQSAEKDTFTVAPSAASGARGAFGGAADAYDAFVAEHGLNPSGR
jgi:hypothetical protein